MFSIQPGCDRLVSSTSASGADVVIADGERRLSSPRVVVVGDVMLDRYWFGGVERISPEAPVPVLAVERREERPGGAANVAANVVAMGGRCTLLSAVGEDEAAADLRALLARSGIDARLQPDPSMSTTVKLRLVARNQQLLRVDFERGPGDEALARCVEQYRRALGDADAVILSDYGKGGLRHIAEMIAEARSAGIPVFVDPKGRDFDRYRGASVITPNLREFEDFVGPWDDESEFDSRARDLVARLGIGSLLVTRSAEGMTLYRDDGTRLHSPAQAREVYDVSGAGDTVIAAITLATASLFSDEAALRFANVAAGLVVGRLGTVAPTLAEIEVAWDAGVVE